MRIGVLALQGDFREHISVLDGLGAETFVIKRATELDSIDGLVIPGGESTTIGKLATNFGLLEPIRARIQSGFPVFGTCAGLILLADRILDGVEGQPNFGGLDISVRRNAFGGQQDSFETRFPFSGIDSPVEAAFIRAPVIESVGDSVQIDARLDDGRIVAVSQDHLMGISFHPEVVGEHRIHGKFLQLVEASRG